MSLGEVGVQIEGTAEGDLCLVGLAVLILAFAQKIERPCIVGSEANRLGETVDGALEVGKLDIALGHGFERLGKERELAQRLAVVLDRLGMPVAGTRNLAHEEIGALEGGVVGQGRLEAALGLSGVGQTEVALAKAAPRLDVGGAAELGGATEVFLGTFVTALIEEDGAKNIIDILAPAVEGNDRLAEVDGLTDAILTVERGRETPTRLDIEGVEGERLAIADGGAVVTVAAVVTHTPGDPCVG